MTTILKPVGEWIAQNVSLTVLGGVFLFSIFFKIPKKEVNILGWVIGMIGKAFTRDLRADLRSMKDDSNNQIKELRKDLDDFEESTKASNERITARVEGIEKSNDMQTIRQIKAHVLDFANSCMNGRRHTVRDFRNIIKENKEYQELVSKYNMKNDVYTDDFEYIMEVYHTCKQNRSFLNDNGKPYDEEDEEE